MKFKSPYMKEQLESCSDKLQEVATYMDAVSKTVAKKEIIITRVLDPVKGESGIHSLLKAFDARIECFNEFGIKERYYTAEEVNRIADYMNGRYKRTDKKLTCIAHSFKEGPEHFHVQINEEMEKEPYEEI